MTGQQLDWSIYGLCRYGGKVRLTTEEEAETFATKCSRRYGRTMRWYRCPKCRAYHLTKAKKG